MSYSSYTESKQNIIIIFNYFRYGSEDKYSEFPFFNQKMCNEYSKSLFQMSLSILNNSFKLFFPESIICFTYKFFSQFILKNQQVNELKEYFEPILNNIVTESLLSAKDIENFIHVRISFDNDYFKILILGSNDVYLSSVK